MLRFAVPCCAALCHAAPRRAALRVRARTRTCTRVRACLTQRLSDMNLGAHRHVIHMAYELLLGMRAYELSS